MPVEEAHPTPELLEALREYHEATGRRIVLAWTMIAGVNTRPEDAGCLPSWRAICRSSSI